jgi:hypothetical protein
VELTPSRPTSTVRNRFGGPDLTAAGEVDRIADTVHPTRATGREANR